MRNARRIAGFLVAAALGFVTPRLVPHAWLGDILGAGLFLVIVWTGLASVGARGGKDWGRGVRALSWLLVGTSRPTAEVTNHLALRLFWMTLGYLAFFGIGAFSAVAA